MCVADVEILLMIFLSYFRRRALLVLKERIVTVKHSYIFSPFALYFENCAVKMERALHRALDQVERTLDQLTNA